MAKRASSSLDVTLSETDKASNATRNNKRMKRGGRTCQTTSHNSTDGDENEWSALSFATPSYMRVSRRQPNINAYSATLGDSTLLGVPPLDALNSTEQSTITRIDNDANELRNMARAKSPVAAPNDDKGAHQNRPHPINGRTHHGRSIDVSAVLPTRNSITKQQRSVNSYLLAPYDDELHTIAEMVALNSTAHSVVSQSKIQRGSVFTGAPSSLAVESGQQTATANDQNAMKKLPNAELVQRSIAPSINANTKVHQNRPHPINGRTHHGRSIDVSAVLPTRNSIAKHQRSVNSYLLAPYDGELHTIPEMNALNSTARLVVAQPELQCDNEATNASSVNVSHRSPIARNQETMSIPRGIAPAEKSKQNVDTTSAQLSNREEDGGENQPHNISVQLFTKSRSQASQNPSASRDAAIVLWMDELTRYWCNIEDQTKSSLKLIKQDRIRRSLPFDEKFKERFMKSAYDKILRAFELFLLDERFSNNFFDTTFVSIDTDQGNRIGQANHSNGDDMHDIELDDTFVCHQVPPAMLSDIQENSHEATVNEISVQICNDDSEQAQQEEDQQVTGEKILDAEILETIELDLDQEEAVDHGGNNDDLNVDNLAGQSEPSVQRKKRKIKSTKTKRNLKEKSKPNDAADTVKRHKCGFCEFSTNSKTDLTRHIRTHTNERPYECNICEKRFTQKTNLNNHMKTHREMFAFHCSICRQGFSDQKQQKLHEKRCNAKRYECYLCKKIVWYKRHLVEHMRAHTGEKLRCSMCRKQFCTSWGLAYHMKSHAKQFRFQCTMCRKGFSQKTQWKLHESRCKSKQFECFLCNKKFYQEKSHLLQHMLHKHTGEKPFGCSDCSMRFCTKSGFTRHTKRCQLKGK